MEELLALRSLVLANETATVEFQGLMLSSQAELNARDGSLHSIADPGMCKSFQINFP